MCYYAAVTLTPSKRANCSSIKQAVESSLMTKVYSLDEILAVLPQVDLIAEIAEGFRAYSNGNVTVPPVAELLFPDDHGELHIKYGAIKGDDVFVIKVATGFFDNPVKGLPPFGGCMLVLSQKTGAVEAVLLEAGELTNHRTAAAGAVAAKYLAPEDIHGIGIIGSGVQARLQADYLRKVTSCRQLTLWARNPGKAHQAADDITAMGYGVTVSRDVAGVCAISNLIVTTTPSKEPLLTTEMVKPGTHVTAMGSDSPDKCELDPSLLQSADIVVADSISQCRTQGEIHHALDGGTISERNILELGQIIDDPSAGRGNDSQITIADLTGVAVQDIAIAKAIVEKLTSRD